MSDIFCFNDTAPTEIYTLSLRDALPSCGGRSPGRPRLQRGGEPRAAGEGERRGDDAEHLLPEQVAAEPARPDDERSEEHTSELPSRQYIVCRLLLEKKTEGAPSTRTDLQ